MEFWVFALGFKPQGWILLLNFSRNWQKIAEFGRLWQKLAEYCRSWQNLAEFRKKIGGIWRNLGVIWVSMPGGRQRRRRRRNFPMCESIGHRPLCDHCPKMVAFVDVERAFRRITLDFCHLPSSFASQMSDQKASKSEPKGKKFFLLPKRA